MANGTDVPAYRLLWAKQANENGYIEKSLLSHMLETAWTCRALITDTSLCAYREYMSGVMGMNEDACVRTTAFIIGMHDIGKCHPLFQIRYGESANIQKLRSGGYFNSPSGYPKNKQLGFRHEYYGGDVLMAFLEEDGWDAETAFLIRNVTHMHHQKRQDYHGYLHKRDESLWAGMQRELYSFMKDTFRPASFTVNEKDMDAFFVFLNGIEMYSDWIASGEIFKDTDIAAYASFAEYSGEIEKRLNRYIGKYRLSAPPCGGGRGRLMKDIMPMTRGWKLHPVQALAERVMAKLDKAFDCAIVEAEMGCGKTEIAEYMAMYLMEHCLTDKKGAYIALPTEATSEVMQPRFLETLKDAGYIGGNGQVPLFTGNAFIHRYMEQYNMGNVGGKNGKELNPFLPSSLKFLHPWAVGTVDQSMKFFLMMKHGALGIDGVNSKILIIDEMHAYDAYMFRILETELRWAKEYRTPVIILSATLSEQLKRRIFSIFVDGDYKMRKEYPLISVCSGGRLEQHAVDSPAVDKEYHIQTEKWLNDPKRISSHALSTVRDGGCLAIIMNTVKSAGDVYKKVKEAADSDTVVMLFHGRMPAGPKERRTEEIVKLFGKDRSGRPKKAVVVATQVIEQSIDVDFDYMMTAVCPIDLLFQRLGRERRHADKGTVRERSEWKSECVVLHDGDDCERVYPYIDNSILLKKTLSVLREKPLLRIPSDIRPLIDIVYADGEGMSSYKMSNTNKIHSADAHTIRNPGQHGEMFLYENRGRLSSVHEATRNSDIKRFDVAFVGQEDFRKATDENVSIEDYIRIKTEYVIPVPSYVAEKIQINPLEGSGVCTYGKSWFNNTILYNTDSGQYCMDEDYIIVHK